MFRSTNKCVFYYKMLHFLAYDAFSIDIYSGLCCHVLREKNRNSMCFFFYHQTRSPFDKYSEENKLKHFDKIKCLSIYKNEL